MELKKHANDPAQVGKAFLEHVRWAEGEGGGEAGYQCMMMLAVLVVQGEGFELYEEYCKNRPNSEELLQEMRAVEQVFFQVCCVHTCVCVQLRRSGTPPHPQEIQTSLGHQLPLASYLLKPVQRITKYQLLLKDFIKHTSEGGLDTARDILMVRVSAWMRCGLLP